MTHPGPARLTGYFARLAPVCVIVRRGPTRWIQLIVWKTDTDEFIPGQWMRGKVMGATLSSDGRFMAISATGIHTRGQPLDHDVKFVCRPPYFSAVVAWVGPRTWGTNLAFCEDDTLVCPYLPADHDYASGPCPFEHLRWDSAQRQERPGVHRHVISEYRGQGYGFDQRRRVVRFDRGRIFVTGEGGRQMVFDANQYRFEPIAPPAWAQDWTAPSGW